jgi:hypothetical protein
MRFSGMLLLFGALAVPAVPVAAQSKVAGTPAKTTTTRVKTVKTPVAKSAVVRSVAAEPVIELPVNGKIVLSNTLKTRLYALLAGTTMTYDEATTGWRNHGQLVAAMNAASNRNLPFSAIHHEVVNNREFLVDAVAIVRGATAQTVIQ